MSGCRRKFGVLANRTSSRRPVRIQRNGGPARLLGMSDYKKPPTKRRRGSLGRITQLILAGVVMLAFFAVLWFSFHGHLWALNYVPAAAHTKTAPLRRRGPTRRLARPNCFRGKVPPNW